ncbi:MAG: hypothetical protein C5B51_00300 [Terriglobia bacterium]|nr:MAG: hypothetical protein C5B51_00300 [Terriglobia bacterium]
MSRSSAIGPVVLLVIVTGCFWKLLTKQYTWADHPDMAYQVLPWYQFEAVSLHSGAFPLWDPHVWGGQPLVGQLQPGAAYPPNWLLFLLPLRDGHIQRVWLHGYFILTHFFAALFCYWLCRDLGRTVSASVFAGLAFGLGGVVGSIGWPQMLNGAIWIPLVLMFYLRVVRGQRPLASAALAGTFLGISFLSGHHQIPTYTSLMMAALWLIHIYQRRVRPLQPAALFVMFTALVSALQTLPGYEYGIRSIRWVGSQNPVSWGQYVPYIVHQQYSLPPLGIIGLALPTGDQNTFIGIAVLTLALLGLTLEFGCDSVRLLGAICAGALLFAMGGFSVFHGIAYLLIPMVEKARTPAMAVVLAQFALSVLASYGIDALRRQEPGRWCTVSLIVIGILPWPVLAVLSSIRSEVSREYERYAVAAMVALALAAVLHARKSKRIAERTAIAILCTTAIFELGTVTGANFRHRETPGGFLQELEKNRDVVTFLRKEPQLVRLEIDPAAVPYNIGDWDGVDQFQAYLGGMTANLVPFEEDRLAGGKLATMLFSLNYFVGRQPLRSGQSEIFKGTSGLKVYRNPEAFPRLWTVHHASSTTSQDLVARLRSANLRNEVFLTGSAPTLDLCNSADDVRVLQRSATRVALDAQMACRGMIVLSQTFFPGWEATVDGRHANLYEAYGAIQGVVVDGGAHEVEIRYRPVIVYWGALLTTLGLTAVLVLGLHARINSRNSGTRKSDKTVYST